MRLHESDQIVRFAAFELDVKAGELRRSGIRLPVQGRPLQVLTVLVKTPGELVTGEQLRKELWPADTFVDFEHGIRNAVARLRAVLGDTAEKPRFIETLPRRGYRFIGVVVAETPPQPAPPAEAAVEAPRRAGWKAAPIAIGSLAVVLGLAAWMYRAHGVRSPIQSVAVLPLENLSGDSAQDYFADGVTDELITMLAGINSLKVISRTSVMQYKAVHNKPLPQIARELGVDAVVEGTVVRAGDRVRVTAQLIEAAADRHIWADSYERSSRDLLLLENEIARAIAEQLRGKLDPQEQGRFHGYPIDPAAHEAYLQGRYLWNRRTPAALKEAIRYFTRAIEIEPRYAEAYAGRAAAYIPLGGHALEELPPAEALPKAKADAEMAVRLNDSSSEAHTALATVRQIYDLDWQGSEAEYRRAIELSPSNANAHQWYGQYLCNLERFPECLAETARAHALDPAYLIAGVDVGIRLYDARRYGEAIGPIQKVLEFNPDFATGHRYLGQVYEANKRYEEAISEFQKAIELSGGAKTDIAALGHAYAVAGRRTEAQESLHKLDDLAKHSYVSSYSRVLIYAGLGEKERALEWLEEAFRERSTSLVKLRIDPRLDPLRGDARFVNLVGRVGFRP